MSCNDLHSCREPTVPLTEDLEISNNNGHHLVNIPEEDDLAHDDSLGRIKRTVFLYGGISSVCFLSYYLLAEFCGESPVIEVMKIITASGGGVASIRGCLISTAICMKALRALLCPPQHND